MIGQEIQALRCTGEASRSRKPGASWDSLCSQVLRRCRACDGEQVFALALGAAYATVRSARLGQLCRSRIHRRAEDCLLNHLGSFAGNLGELAHPVGAEWK